MYQMLTGSLPYDTPAPADLARLARGELLTAPRLKNPKIPKGHQRHRPARDGAGPDRRAISGRQSVLNDLLAAARAPPRDVPPDDGAATTADETVAEIQSRLKARETPQATFLLALPQAAPRQGRSLSVLQEAQ